MTEQEQIKVISELDGFNKQPTPVSIGCSHSPHHDKPNWSFIHQLPKYLTSRDAIVPVIENLPYEVRCRIAEFLFVGSGSFAQILLTGLLATPKQICEALLRATGKWKD